ncbi:MAG TPA: hypothetical protein VEG30_06820, partial [Terriglobales bacterium]|nr:hypothetical protein [Terriglobales bacterium]
QNLLAGTTRGIDWHYNLGVVVLGMLLVISIVAVLSFLILPLALYRGRRTREVRLPALLFFVGLGLGYILVEVSLIQRFVLFLGHPTYALTVVVFLLLLSSGLGSASIRRPNLLLTLGAIVALIALNALFIPKLLSIAVGLTFPLKLIISALILIPLGFLMGMPFPRGLKLIAENETCTVEWAWAMNAGASVLGSVMAMIIAIHLGLTMTLVSAAIAYSLAAVCWECSKLRLR